MGVGIIMDENDQCIEFIYSGQNMKFKATQQVFLKLNEPPGGLKAVNVSCKSDKK